MQATAVGTTKGLFLDVIHSRSHVCFGGSASFRLDVLYDNTALLLHSKCA